jgi:membrane protein
MVDIRTDRTRDGAECQPDWPLQHHPQRLDWVGNSPRAVGEDAPLSLDEGGPPSEKRRNRAVRWCRDRYEGSAAQDIVKGLDDVEFGNWIIIFGASFLLSVLPLILLLGAFANSRVDDNIDTRLGLSHNDAHIIDALFKTSHAGWGFGVVLALIFSWAGTIAVARSIQKLYQQVFGRPNARGWGNVGRCLVWAVAAALEVYVDAFIGRPLRDLPAGRIFLGLGNLVIATALFWWGLHWLLRSQETWRRLFPAGLATGVFWVGLGAVVSVYFPSTLTSDNRLYGAIGVVFDLVTWFVAMGAVITLGALAGHTYIVRRQCVDDREPGNAEPR